MQRPGIAARRFYGAFYRWSVLTSTTESRLPPCASTFHSLGAQANEQESQLTPRRRIRRVGYSNAEDISLKNLGSRDERQKSDEDWQDPPSNNDGKVRFHSSRGWARSSRGPESSKETGSRVQSKDGERRSNDDTTQRPRNRYNFPEAMLEGPVLSAGAKPFHSMSAGEYVVRFRSEAGLMLEYAIAGDVLQKAQTKYGEQLQRLKDDSGARIEVQALLKKRDGVDTFGPESMVHSVLISGTFRQVVDAFNGLLRTRIESREVKQQQSKAPDSKFSHEMPVGISPEKLPRVWRNAPVQSTTKLPSSDLRIGKPVVRSRSADKISVETAYPVENVRLMQVRYGGQLEYLEWKHGCHIRVLEPDVPKDNAEEALDASEAASASKIPNSSVLITGGWVQALSTHDAMLVNRRNVQEHVFEPSTVESREVLPGSALFRSSAVADLALEVVAIEKYWQWMLIEGQITTMAATLNLSIEQGGILTLQPSGVPVDCRSITFAGPRLALLTIRGMFKTCHERCWDREHQANDSREQKDVSAMERRKQSPDDAGAKQIVGAGNPKGSPEISSLIEMCPPEHASGALLGSTLSRLRPIRNLSRCWIRGPEDKPYLQLLQGTREQVEQAKAAITETVFKGFEKLRLPARGIRVLHEQRGWMPSWEEVYEVAARSVSNATQPGTESTVAKQTTVSPDNQVTPSLALYRCGAILTGRDRTRVMQMIQGFMTNEELKVFTGCWRVTSSARALVAHGSLDAVAKFRSKVRRLVEKARAWPNRFEVKIETRVHAAISNTWAKVPEVDAQNGSSGVSAGMDPAEVTQMAEDIRIALRPLCHPVVLITSQTPALNIDTAMSNSAQRDTSKEDPASRLNNIRRCRGVTVSSFNTVTLKPHPIISFNIKIPSRSWDTISESGILSVHLLTATPMGVAIADVFTQHKGEPHEGFLTLEKMGVSVTAFGHDCPPRVFHKEGVLAEIRAKLLPDRSVQVGDHFIVVARVSACRILREDGMGAPSEMDQTFWGSIQTLAYAKQKYRSMGEQVWKEGSLRLPEELPDPLSLGLDVDQVEAQRGVAMGNAEPLEKRSYRPVTDRPAQSAPRHNRNTTQVDEELEFEKMMGGCDDLSPAARQEEEEYDFGFETPNYGVKREHRRAEGIDGRSQDVADGSAPLWAPDDLAREDSIRLGGTSEQNADGLQQEEKPEDGAYRPMQSSGGPAGNRTFSTFARPQKTQAGSIRHFSTTARVHQDDASDPKPDLTTLVEPSARNMNVADYLGIPETARLHSHRARALYRMNKDARRFEKRLYENVNDLTEEEKTDLRHKITTSDRVIAKKLAWNAAYHLRIMLDKGRVDFKRARFLEAAIERGQAVLLEEAGVVREMFEKGRISKEQLGRVRERMGRTAEVLQTEVGRLGMVVDEDEDGGGGVGYPGVDDGEGEGDGGFDGFSGNR